MDLLSAICPVTILSKPQRSNPAARGPSSRRVTILCSTDCWGMSCHELSITQVIMKIRRRYLISNACNFRYVTPFSPAITDVGQRGQFKACSLMLIAKDMLTFCWFSISFSHAMPTGPRVASPCSHCCDLFVRMYRGLYDN